jgi:hypothetical protein
MLSLPAEIAGFFQSQRRGQRKKVNVQQPH